METVSEGKSFSGSGNAFSRSFFVDGKYADGKKILHVFDDQSAARHFAETRAYVRGLKAMGAPDGKYAVRAHAKASELPVGSKTLSESDGILPKKPEDPTGFSNAELGMSASEIARTAYFPSGAPSFLSDDADLFDFACAASGEFVSTYGIFDAKRYSPYFLNKKILRVSVGDRLGEMAFVSKLLGFLYAFQEYSADPWTYRRDGDSVTVRTSRERVIVSFFDGEIDAISVLPPLGGTPVPVPTFVFPDRTAGERLSDAPDSVSSAVAE
ncbi:MAG: Transcription-repair coupling factor [Patescibacteria group bacterium]|nr:Transcription-repair coupling factor [Patescibacteria group bacterium]